MMSARVHRRSWIVFEVRCQERVLSLSKEIDGGGHGAEL